MRNEVTDTSSFWTSSPGRGSALAALFAVILAASGLVAESMRDQVEADWQRQDERALALVREPGRVWFVEAEIEWPGVRSDERLRVPRCRPPLVDGRLDDVSWGLAARLSPSREDQPEFLLCHDGKRLYAGASLPTAHAVRYGEHFTARDAAGAVDGVKNGSYGFHSGLEPNPWWQVDLGKPLELARIVIYNRLDYPPGLHNADRLVVLTSNDGANWTERYDNEGRPFGGVSRGKPLEVVLPSPAAGSEYVRARFVRLLVRQGSPVFFHLDEVEIYGRSEPSKNVALGRPATQSSLSQWSRGGQRGCALFTLGTIRVGLVAGNSPGITVNGGSIPEEEGRVFQEGERTSLEVALPFSGTRATFPGTFLPPEGAPIPLALGSNSQITWRQLGKLGFGRNRIAIEVHAAGPIHPPVQVTAEAVVFTSLHPERQLLVETMRDHAGSIPVDFEISNEGPAAVIVTERQGQVCFRDGRAFLIAPVATTLRRAQRLHADFGLPSSEALAQLQRRARALEDRERATGPDPAARAALCREVRWLAREIAFSNPRLDFGRLLFVKRYTQETYPDVCLNHMPWVSRPGGDICVLSSANPDRGVFAELARRGETGTPEPPVRVRNILAGSLGRGHVHGVDLSWDATRVVFGYAKARSESPPAGWLDRRTSYDLRRSEEPIHIFEVGIDGGRPRQLTDGEWSDLDPTYLPNGDIAFASERCGYSLQCNEYDKDETSCNLYVMRPDGSRIRRLSVTKDGDYLPHTFADGTIGYTRWEYQERGWAHIQSVWTVRPDGTGEDAVFKQHFNDPWALEDTRSVPSSRKLVAIATGHHTLPAGPVVLVDPSVGLNNPRGIGIVTPGVSPPEGGMSGVTVPEGGVAGRGGYYMTPWPLSDEHFLVSFSFAKQTDPNGYAIYLIDVHGTKELVYRDPSISSFVPIPLRPRPRPPILPDLTEPKEPHATCVVSDVARGVEGVAPEEIRYLRISQRMAWPYDNRHGGQRYESDVKQVMVNWTPVRVIGTVPVEADGSAYFQVPVDTPLYFQLLDENHMELRRMRSFVSFQPGEVRACAGCHETQAVAPAAAPMPMALRRQPSMPVPPPWGDRVVSFLRDVQPVFDRHCVSCHGGWKPAAGLDFSGGLTDRHNRAYDTIQAHGLVARSNVGDDARVTPPLAFGSRQSKLIEVLGTELHEKEVELGRDDWLRLVTWIDANAPYHDGFINKRPDHKPYELTADAALKGKIAAVHARRCSSCHRPAELSRVDWIDLGEPRRTLFLKAPLAKKAGGTAKCKGAAGSSPASVYRDRNDPDYRVVLEIVKDAVEKAWRHPRRDLRAFEHEPSAP